MSEKEKDGVVKETEMEREPADLFKRWSSHPESLEPQRKKWLLLGLIPLGVGVAVLALQVTGTSGWGVLLRHPGVACWTAAGLVALSLGAEATYALLLAMARGAVASATKDEDRVPFPMAWVVAAALYWVIPGSLMLAQVRWGVRLVPQQVLFLLNLLCFVPLAVLLAWVRKAEGKTASKKGRGWVPFVALYAGVAGLTLLGDAQGWLADLKFPEALAGLSPLVRRAVLLATLLPLSLVAWALWRMARGAGLKKKSGGDVADPGPGAPRKPWWRRLWEFLFGAPEPATEAPAEEKTEPKPPVWLGEFCAALPEGVRVASRNPPAPDPFPDESAESSPFAEEKEGDDDTDDTRAFRLLMGGGEERRPTEGQMKFFLRFRDAWGEALAAARNGMDVSPDVVLSGEEGSGRTEALFATVLYAAFARRQRVLFLVADAARAEALAETANGRFRAMFLDTFLRCGVLDESGARRWTRALKGRNTDSGDGTPSPLPPDAESVPPNIVVSTPRQIERIFFEGRGADSDPTSLDALRALLRLFEVVAVDDFMELGVVERAHLPFLLHKMRLLLESGNRRPQFAVVSPKLRPGGGAEAVRRMLGEGFDAEKNIVRLAPRKCEPAWSLPLVLADDLRTEQVGEELAKRCLALKADNGSPLRVVLYRRGLHPDQCSALAAKIGVGRGTLRVVSRLDELGEERGADAVFHLTALSGGSEMAIRLSAGDERTVYVSLSTESEAVFAGVAAGGVLPALPDASAAGLRVHHLRSVLRHVRPGQPMGLSVWQRFGVFLDNEDMRVVDPDEGAVAYETWRQDEWTESKYGEPPLWKYIVYESRPSIKSNAGKGTDFGLVPSTDEDIVRIGDTPVMGLARPKDAAGQVSATRGSVARWVDAQGIDRGAVDLAHAETLLFGRSEYGDTMGDATKGHGAVYTVQAFKDPKPGKESEGVCRLQMTPWQGAGRDLDTPVRTLAWFVEPGGAPLEPVLDTARAVTFFGLPDFRGMPRRVGAAIAGMANRLGETRPELPPRGYDYPASFSAFLLAPRRLDPKDGVAQIQRSVVGAWDTADGTFSWVLTHLFTGVLERFIPDFPFYALLPVFHQHGREGAVAPAIAWLVQPRNTGRAVEEPVLSLLQPKDGADFFAVLREARKLFEKRPDPPSKLRWLRSFSRSAFECDLSVPEVAAAFDRDIQDSAKLLDALDERLAGRAGEVEGYTGPVPVLPRDTSWMSAPREFAATGFLDASAWNSVGQLPPPPAIGGDGKPLEWEYSRKKFKLQAGFGAKGDMESYTGFFRKRFRKRVGVSGTCYTEYGFNDPYREFTQALADELLSLCGQTFPKATDAQRAEFLLAFVQAALAYTYDPKDVDSDWPRHPSETVFLAGGDCEDTAILYAELLRRARIGNAILSIPRHAAVGVDVPMSLTSDHKKPIVYTWLGTAYVYGETANNHFCTPLGRETDLIPSAELVRANIIPTPVLSEDDETPVRILNAVGPNSGSLTITLLAVRDVPGLLALAVFARPRKEVFAAPAPDSYPCVGGAKISSLKAFEVVEANVKLNSPAFKSFWYDVFVCEAEGGAVRGHFVGVGHYA